MKLTLTIPAFLAFIVPGAYAGIVYQNLPTAPGEPIVSFHNATGPVIADEFEPIAGGQVTTITWWGSAAPSNTWELVLQNNDPLLGQPALTPDGNNLTGGVKAVGVVASGVPYAPLSGVFQFTADFSNFASFDIEAGTAYWITVANFANDWSWTPAASGPTIGSETLNGHRSVGGADLCLDGGPHCGPWRNINTNFAVEISAVSSAPEPTTLALLGIGLAGLGLSCRKRAN